MPFALVIATLGFASTHKPSGVYFVEELNRNDHNCPHSLGLDPVAGQPRISPEFAASSGRTTLGPKIAAEMTMYPAGYGEPHFYHGVASGSPTRDAVVVWTRYTPGSPDVSIPVELRMAPSGADALDEKAPIKYVSTAEAKNDWVIKIDVRGLKPGTEYVYAFVAEGKSSMVGITRTAPTGHVEEMHYALFSCSDWAQGFFHPYDHASIMEHLDFWIHVGDYIYEYGFEEDEPDKWGYRATRWPTGETKDPPWEIVELNDYRRRYGIYHTDHALQQLRARAPMIATWDDHEITNNWFIQGAQNHQSVCQEGSSTCTEHEGSFVERVNAGAKAYLEWMPIRRGTDDQSGLMDTDIKQVIEWGDLATVVSVDTRGFARSSDYVGGWTKPGASVNSPDGNPNSAVSAAFGEGRGGYASSLFSEFVDDAAGGYPMSDYETEGTQAYRDAVEFKQNMEAARFDKSRKKLGDYQLDFLLHTFNESKKAGKTWQMFADATTQAAWMGPDLRLGADAVPELKDDYLTYVNDLIDDASGISLYNWRACAATAFHQIPMYNDDSNAAAYERMLMMRGFKEVANNVITHSGDVHDSRADTLYTDGNVTGEPEAVHFTAGGVTCQWWGDALWWNTGFNDQYDVTTALKFARRAMEESTPGTKFWNLKDRGFWAFKVTHEKHVGEHINANYDAEHPVPSSVRIHDPRGRYYGNTSVISWPYKYFHDQGELTAPYYCAGSLVTLAGQPGSLDYQDACEIKFLAERPAALSTPVPV